MSNALWFLIVSIISLAASVGVSAQSVTNKVLIISHGGAVEIPSRPELQNGQAITVEAWIYPTENGVQNPVYLSKGDFGSVSSNQSYWMGWSAYPGVQGRVLHFNLFLGAQTWVFLSATNVASNMWTHVAVTYDSAASMARLFTNGVVASVRSLDAHDDPINSQLVRQSTLPLVLGSPNPAYASNTASSGAIDEVRIWSRALSPMEILAEFRCGALVDSSLKGKWSFNGDTPHDDSGNGNDGVLAGGASIGGWAGADLIHAECDRIRAAAATLVVINGFVVGASITEGGGGYKSAPNVTISGGGGVGATAVAVIDSKGTVSEIRILTTGSGYSSTPSITIDPPPFPPSQAKGSANVINGFVTGVEMIDTGHGYEGVIPPVTFLGGGGTGATGTAIVRNGMVTGVTMTATGSGYTDAPRVLIAAPPGVPKLGIEVSQVRVLLTLIPGYTYQLQMAADAGAAWINVGPQFLATDAHRVQTLDVTGQSQIFRIIQVN